jgi:hypothetical protein
MKELSQEQQSQRHSLSPEDLTTYLELIIEDPDGQPVIIRLTDKETRDWNGSTWVHSPFKLSGISNQSTGERNRPSLSLPNEGGIYSYYLNQGLLEDSVVTRYKALPHENGGTLTSKHVFYVSHASNISASILTLQLRKLSDGNKTKFPPRRYIQPEFSTVVV